MRLRDSRRLQVPGPGLRLGHTLQKGLTDVRARTVAPGGGAWPSLWRSWGLWGHRGDLRDLARGTGGGHLGPSTAPLGRLPQSCRFCGPSAWDQLPLLTRAPCWSSSSDALSKPRPPSRCLHMCKAEARGVPQPSARLAGPSCRGLGTPGSRCPPRPPWMDGRGQGPGEDGSASCG